MPSFLADYRDLPPHTRIATAILLPILLLAGVIGGNNATTYVAAIGERCALEMPIGTIVELDITGIFAERIARNKWMLTSDLIVDNCYVKAHIRQTKADCETQDRACRLTLSHVGATIRTSDGQTWTKIGLNEWQNGSGDIQNDAAMFEQSTSTQHNAAGTSGQPNCKKEEPTDHKPCSSASAPRRRGADESSSSSSSSADTCTAVYYKFDEGAGTTTLNALGSSHIGSLINNPAWSTDHAPTLFQNSGALAFDGSNKVTIPTLAVPARPFTISTWIKSPMTEHADQLFLQWNEYSRLAVGHQTYTTFDCGSGNDPGGWYDHYFHGDTAAVCGNTCSENGYCDLPPSNVQQFENYYFTATSPDWKPNCELWDGAPECQMPHDAWVHLTYVDDGSSRRRLYVNGVDVGPAGGWPTSWFGMPTSWAGLTIGNINSDVQWGITAEGTHTLQQLNQSVDWDALYGYYEPFWRTWYWYPAQGFNGLIDDVRMYTRALSASEVALLATGQDVSFGCEVSSSSSTLQSSASSSADSSETSSTDSSTASTAESSADASAESSTISAGTSSNSSSSTP